MKHFINLTVACGISLSLGCAPSVEDIKYQPEPFPDFDIELPDFDIADFKLENKMCERAVTDLDTALTDGDEKTSLTVEIPQQLTIEKDCKGAETDKGLQSIDHLKKFITVLPPKEFTERVTKVEVFNQRNCTTISNYNWLELEPSKEIIWPYSRFSADGKIEISLSTFPLGFVTTVSEGLNVLDITYLGSCVDKECQKAKLLGTKRMVLDVKIDKPVLGGNRVVDRCVR